MYVYVCMPAVSVACFMYVLICMYVYICMYVCLPAVSVACLNVLYVSVASKRFICVSSIAFFN